MTEEEIIEPGWEDVWLMFEDIREHAKNNGRTVVNEDQPQNLKLGWRCTTTDKVWLISTANISRSAGDSDKRNFLMKHISSAAGKEALTVWLNALA